MVAAKSPEIDEHSFTLIWLGGTLVVAGSNPDVVISAIQALRLIDYVHFLITTNWN